MIQKLFDAMFAGTLTKIEIFQVESEDRSYRLGAKPLRDSTRFRLVLHVRSWSVGLTFHPDDKERPDWEGSFKKSIRGMLHELHKENQSRGLLELANAL